MERINAGSRERRRDCVQIVSKWKRAGIQVFVVFLFLFLLFFVVHLLLFDFMLRRSNWLV